MPASQPPPQPLSQPLFQPSSQGSSQMFSQPSRQLLHNHLASYQVDPPQGLLRNVRGPAERPQWQSKTA